MKKIKHFLLVFLLIVVSQNFLLANIIKPNFHNKNISKDSLNWNTKLPFDNQVIRGILPNGFQYFIRKNSEPKDRVTIYLATKVGSILENEEQLGLAHFMEHMNFNGLKHFPKNELVDYLQKIGVRFGSDLNAYTGFDQTVYKLPIPSDDPELLKNGLQVIRDWAQDALLTDEEIDKERGVVLEELRGGQGAFKRLQDKYLPLLLNNSRYSERLPIGKEDIISNFSYETLRKFHKDWYRPDLQAIIVVGDIDEKQIEKDIKRLFSDLKKDPNSPERIEYKVPLLDKNQFIAISDEEMPYTVGNIIIKHPKREIKNIGDFRKNLLISIYNNILDSRLNELGKTTNPPFLSANVGIGSFIGGLDSFNASVVAKPSELETGFKALIRELERIQKHGITETEFKRAIINFNKENETSYVERDKKKSISYVNSYLNYYLEDSPALSDEDMYTYRKKLLSALTINEVENIGKQYYVDINRDIIILTPESEKDNIPSENEVISWFSDVRSENILAYEDKISDLPLLSNPPKNTGKIVHTKEISPIEAKEILLSNGVKVILKPTTFKNDEILIDAHSLGGTSLYSDADYYSASFADDLINASGLGQLNHIELEKYLTGKRVNINTYISETEEGLSGNSDKESLETAFEMIYAYFTEPRIDEDVFQSSITKYSSMIANQKNDPNFVFNEEVKKSLYDENIRRISVSEEGLKQINKERSLNIYKERFEDASDFVFVFVGSFTEEEINPYLEKYLASLPSLKKNEKPKNLGIYEPKKGFEKLVYKGLEQKVNVSLAYFGNYNYSDLEELNMDALESILSIKLIERLREEESGVYGVSASSYTYKYPKGRYGFYINFGTGVNKYQSLISSTLEEINKIKENGPLNVDLDKFKIERKRQLELSLKENNFWISEISKSYRFKEDPTHITRYLQYLDKITTKSVKKTANKYLKNKGLFKFILLPENVQ